MSEPVVERALTAPRRSGEALVEPPLDTVAALIESNAALPTARVELLRRSIADLAAAARRHLLDEASRYSRQYRDIPSRLPTPPSAPPRVLLAGHQPELFHPGVWFKNFVLDRLARRHAAVAVNFIVDHDTCRQTSIRVPTGSAEEPRVERVAFDAAAAVVPWEERGIADAATFRSFGRRASDVLRPLVPAPLLDRFWPLAVEAAGRGPTLGAALAQARHAYEASIGLQTLEVPLSTLCRGEAFAWFVAWLAAEAPRVRDAYNAAVRDYRRANHVRSASHPVPDLAGDGELCEAPLWVWSRSNPRRRRLFVARRTDCLTFTDREGWTCDVPRADVGSPSNAVERILTLDAEGVRLRPRALTTTWYARLLLGDLFIHGIGGAKYDEVTDRIIADLFGIAPPAYVTATATLHLPIHHETDAERELADVRKRRRDLLYHAETVIANSDEAWRQAVRAKQACIDEYRRAAGEPWQRELARRRHRAVTAANAALAPWTETLRQALDAQELRLAHRARGQQLLESREYAFCLFPRDAVVDPLLALAAGDR